jgi:hypothetical protein
MYSVVRAQFPQYKNIYIEVRNSLESRSMSRDDLILMGRQLNSIKVARALSASALTQIPLTQTVHSHFVFAV